MRHWPKEMRIGTPNYARPVSGAVVSLTSKSFDVNKDMKEKKRKKRVEANLKKGLADTLKDG